MSSDASETARLGRSISSSGSGTADNEAPQVDRRQLMGDRNWQSEANLFRNNPSIDANGQRLHYSEVPTAEELVRMQSVPSRANTTRVSLSQAELWHFHENWTTGNSEDMFGASSVPFASQQRSPIKPSIVLSPRVSASGLSSAIHDAARITNWDRVLELCASNPQDAKYSGRDGWTALHHACNRRCPRPEVVEALIGAYPGALDKPEEKGWLPLHYACRFKAPKEVVRLLLHMYPKRGFRTVSKTDRLGRTPLYYAVRYDAPSGVVGLLLEVDPSAVLEEDENQESPLALVWDSWAEKLEGKRIVNSFLPGGFPEPEDRTVEERAKLLQEKLRRESKLYKRWIKVNMLLKAAFGFTVEEDDADRKLASGISTGDNSGRVWRIVHATASVKCHPSLFLMACALHPEQVQELDDNDLRRPGDICPTNGHTNQTALHLAASSKEGGEPGKTVLLTLLSQYREAAQVPDDIDGSIPLHRMVENEHKKDWSNHAAILYRFYPRGVQISDSNGKLPLHRAITAIQEEEGNPEECVISQLVRVYPQAASHADNSGILPMHLIAMNASEWSNATDAICNANRNAVASRCGATGHNRLAIHLAAASPKSRDSLIARLIQLHQRSAALEDGKGCLPMHLACEIGKNWQDGVRAIHVAFPEAVRQPERNERGWFPLHLAAKAGGPLELITKLIELFPEAAEIADRNGQYPLHLACQSGMKWSEGLELIFEAAPYVMTATDHKGLLPFHHSTMRVCEVTRQVEREHDDNGEDEVTHGEINPNSELDDEAKAVAAQETNNLYEILRADPSVLKL
ncbi:hypothetical protein MPSEU_000427900 [Mayamaea pseudoterrestris]|nr:hypothetical protein MPSEU_000427900 [Mayamaea pseudoterrestris]